MIYIHLKSGKYIEIENKDNYSAKHIYQLYSECSTFRFYEIIITKDVIEYIEVVDKDDKN